MKKKQSLFIVYTVLFLVLCLLPSLGLAVLGPSPLLANESATRTPVFRNRDGSFNSAVLSDASDYVEARFAFRPRLVSARSFLFEKLLQTSAEPQVVLGRGGELFYTSTLNDYSGIGLTDDELRQIAVHLKEIQDTLEAQGKTFVFTVAPNKNSVIPDAMPGRFPENLAGSNYRRLLPLLEEAGVCTLDLHSLLAGQEDLYYRTDSHWTAEGAALAADALLETLGRSSAFSAGPFAREGVHVGDLYQMLYPTGKGREAETVYAPGFSYETEADPRDGNALTIRSSSAAGSGSLYCLRDSFGIGLYPYLAEAFSTAEFSRSADYSTEAFEGLEADTVILEIVERNLSRLLPEEDPGT